MVWNLICQHENLEKQIQIVLKDLLRNDNDNQSIEILVPTLYILTYVWKLYKYIYLCA